MKKSFNEYQWLISDQAQSWLTETFGRRESGQDFLKISKWLRKQFSPERSALILELVQNRNRAIRKFEKAEQMFFTRSALEMATDQWIASYKANRFREFGNVADICCSVGGDLIALASALKTGRCHGYDNDALAVVYANANLKSHGIENAEAFESSFSDVPLEEFDAIHIDPDRRKQGRSTNGSAFSPTLDSLFERLVECKAYGIKVAPATQLEFNQAFQVEREWIGRRRECQQQMIWFGKLAKYRGCRVATRLGKSGSVTSFALQEEEIATRRVSIAKSIQQYVYEPHSALLASGLADAYATQLRFEKVAPDIFYYTSDSRIKNRLFARFKISQTMKASLSNVAQAVQDAGFGDLEIKKRGVAESVVESYRRIKLKGMGRGSLLLCPFNNQVVAMIAVRESAS